MRGSMVVAALFAAAALAAHGSDGVELSLKSKAAASIVTSREAAAPYVAGHDPLPQILFLEEQENRAVARRSGTCEFTARDVCYDLADGRIVYRPAREYMPRFEGLKAESISLRSNRLVLKYSFR